MDWVGGPDLGKIWTGPGGSVDQTWIRSGPGGGLLSRPVVSFCVFGFVLVLDWYDGSVDGMRTDFIVDKEDGGSVKVKNLQRLCVFMWAHPLVHVNVLNKCRTC